MKTADLSLVREMEVAVFDVQDWSEVLHMAAAGLSEPAEREAFQTLARTIRGLGKTLREQWKAAAQVDEWRRPCA